MASSDGDRVPNKSTADSGISHSPDKLTLADLTEGFRGAVAEGIVVSRQAFPW
jgi:hypothetical protein